MRTRLHVFFHRDVFGVDGTSVFVRTFCRELSKYFTVSLFVYADVSEFCQMKLVDFNIFRVPRLRLPLFWRLMRSPLLKRMYDSLTSASPKIYLVSKRFDHADLVLCVDAYCGVTLGPLSKLDGKRFIFRPNDSLHSLAREIWNSYSRILGVLVALYATLSEGVCTRFSDLILASSRKTMITLERYYGPGKKIIVSHTGTAVTSQERPMREARVLMGLPEDKPIVLFLGSGSWIPNQVAIRYIQGTLAPFLQAEIPNALILIVGMGTEEFRRTVTTNNVKVVGEVAELGPFLDAADLAIAPMILMGGQCTKAIDYLCRGMPVVATPNAAETLEPQVGLYVSDLEHFHETVAAILKKEKLMLNMRGIVREQALLHYSWEKIGHEAATSISVLRQDKKD